MPCLYENHSLFFNEWAMRAEVRAAYPGSFWVATVLVFERPRQNENLLPSPMPVRYELLASGPVNECSAFTAEGMQRLDAQVAMSSRPRQLRGMRVDNLRVGLGEAAEFQEECATRVCPGGGDLASSGPQEGSTAPM